MRFEGKDITNNITPAAKHCLAYVVGAGFASGSGVAV